MFDIDRRRRYRREVQRAERTTRPGREGQATVGHEFLTEPALTKTSPHFMVVVAWPGGALAATTYGVYGLNTYGDGSTYGKER